MIIIVQIIDVNGDIGFESVCREAELMADSYHCLVQAVSESGKKKNFEKKDKWEDMEGVDLSGKKFDEFTPNELEKMSWKKFYREKAKQTMRDHPKIYEFHNGDEIIKLHVVGKIVPHNGLKDMVHLATFAARRNEQFLLGVILAWKNVDAETMAHLDTIKPEDLGQPTKFFTTEYSLWDYTFL